MTGRYVDDSIGSKKNSLQVKQIWTERKIQLGK
jgi:hypothetical protein